MSFFKRNFKYCCVFLFVCSILIYFGFSVNEIDSIYCYGFSYSIAKGLVPYRDFNMIITPLYSFVMSIGLFLVSHNNVIFLIEHALVITFSFYFLYKTFGSSAWLFLAFMCFPSFLAFSATYNFFCFFLVTVILYLEKDKKSDYLIGLVLGLLILTKQTVGVCLLLPSVIIYFKDKRKLFKRFVGLCIPCFLFLLYLLVTRSFWQFFDLCFLGLFDFAEKNTSVFNPYFYLSIVLLFFVIIYIFKNKKDILGWYVLFAYSVMLPIFNHYHFYVYVLFFSLLIISMVHKRGVKEIYLGCFSLFICLNSILSNFIIYNVYENIRVFSFKNFNYYIHYSERYEYLDRMNILYNEYKEKSNTILLSCDSIYIHIINEENTSYFTILNRGNHGWDGSNKMINKIKELNDTYFIISLLDVNYKHDFSQFDLEIIDYIRENGEFIDESDEFAIYYME